MYASMQRTAGAILVTAAFVLPLSNAQAHNFCVSTAAQLQSALHDAGSGGAYNNESNIIRVVKGTYKTGSATGNGPFYYYSTNGGHMDLYGGYNAGCTSTSWNATQTVLDGNNATQVLSLYSRVGEVDVVGFTIQNGYTDQPGAGVTINGYANLAGAAIVIGNIVRNNHSTTGGGGVNVYAGIGNLLLLANNVIVDNIADQGVGAGFAVGNGDESLIYNNTVSGNTGVTDLGGLFLNGQANTYVINNIFWNNTYEGLRADSANVLAFDYNDYGTVILGNVPENIGNLSVPPQFVNRNAGNYHLAAGSPLIDASPDSFGFHDPDGNTGSGAMENIGAYH